MWDTPKSKTPWTIIPISSSRGSSQPRNQTHISCVPCIDRWILYHCASWDSHCPQKRTSKWGCIRNTWNLHLTLQERVAGQYPQKLWGQFSSVGWQGPWKFAFPKCLGLCWSCWCRAGSTGLEDLQLPRMTPSATWLIKSHSKAELALKVHLVLVRWAIDLVLLTRCGLSQKCDLPLSLAGEWQSQLVLVHKSQLLNFQEFCKLVIKYSHY